MRAADERLYAELRALVRPFVARRVQPSDVDDVVQDVLLRVLRGLASLRDDRRLGPWIYQVARSAIAEHRRARARHAPARAHPRDEEAEPLDEQAEERGDGEAERRLATAIAPLVASLPARYREVLTLTELQGRTQREAAAALGLSLPGLKSRVLRGRALLRASLERCCEIGVDVRGRVVECEPRACAPEGSPAACCQRT